MRKLDVRRRWHVSVLALRCNGVDTEVDPDPSLGPGDTMVVSGTSPASLIPCGAERCVSAHRSTANTRGNRVPVFLLTEAQVPQVPVA